MSRQLRRKAVLARLLKIRAGLAGDFASTQKPGVILLFPFEKSLAHFLVQHELQLLHDRGAALRLRQQRAPGIVQRSILEQRLEPIKSKVKEP